MHVKRIEYLENCILTLLSKYRYKDRKDYFKTSIKKIIEAISVCEECLIKFKCNDCKQNNNSNNTNKNETFIGHLKNNHLNNENEILFKLDKINE